MNNVEAAAQSPLISVICRSIGRPLLHSAVASVAQQSYPNIELVLVCAGGEPLDITAEHCSPAKLTVVNKERPLARAAAANAGLTAASGDYLLFLDDDDWLAPQHLADLFHDLQQQPELKAVYSSVQKTDVEGNPTGFVFATDYDPVLLLRDNYIPIHAMLFAKELVTAGCRFDEAMDIYEDWDFWLQLQQHTGFHHVDAVTAFYRDGGDSETATNEIDLRYRNDHLLGQARSYLFSKWLPRMSGEQFNSLLGQLDQSALVAELDANVAKEHAANLAHQEQIAELLTQLEAATHEANVARAELQNTRDSLQAQIATLEQRLQALYNSTSWKLTGPLRRASRLLRNTSPEQDPTTDHQEPRK